MTRAFNRPYGTTRGHSVAVPALEVLGYSRVVPIGTKLSRQMHNAVHAGVVEAIHSFGRVMDSGFQRSVAEAETNPRLAAASANRRLVTALCARPMRVLFRYPGINAGAITDIHPSSVGHDLR
jgi:hypothetical protein